MPIFVSRFSTERVAGANLQSVRGRGNEEEGRSRASRVAERNRSERADEIAPGRAARTRDRGELPVATQQADDVRSRLQVGADRTVNRRPAASTRAASQSGTSARSITTKSEDDASGTVNFAARRPTSAGVGIERSRAGRDIERPGRLGDEGGGTSPALSRFEGLRAAAQQLRSGAVRNGLSEATATGRNGNQVVGTSQSKDDASGTVDFAARRPTSAGVGIERSRAERDIERPGRLGDEGGTSPTLSRFEGLRAAVQQLRSVAARNGLSEATATGRNSNQVAGTRRQLDPAVAEAIDRFENLRPVAREGRPRGRAGALEAAGIPAGEATQGRGRVWGSGLEGLPTVRTPETPGLDRETDARIRLVANASRQAGAAAFREAETTPAPTAEQISRANTTEEIRDNLQTEIREVERGLLRDVDTQNRAITRQTVQNAQQASEQRRESEIQSNNAETRELRTEERRLKRELAATEREIRQRQSETARVQSGAGSNTAAAAGALGSRVNILAA